MTTGTLIKMCRFSWCFLGSGFSLPLIGNKITVTMSTQIMMRVIAMRQINLMFLVDHSNFFASRAFAGLNQLINLIVNLIKL